MQTISRANITIAAYHMFPTSASRSFHWQAGRKESHPDGDFAALSLKPTSENVENIDGVYPFDVAFLPNFPIMGETTPSCKRADVWPTKVATNINTMDRPRPIGPQSFTD
jgi:hypothetical protein